jgi:hypothetical protein
MHPESLKNRAQDLISRESPPETDRTFWLAFRKEQENQKEATPAESVLRQENAAKGIS